VGYLSDIFQFEKSNLGSMWGRLKKDPERAFIGAIDPAGSKAWGGVMGKDYSPMLDMGGGAAPGAYREAEAKGINTTAGKNMHRLARAIAAYNAGSYGLSAMGYGGGATAANMNATNPALIDSALGTPGYGASSAGPGGMGAAPPMGGQQMPQMGQQQQQQPDDDRMKMLMLAEMLRQQGEQNRKTQEDAQLLRNPVGGWR
jgi:hypothetical protein